MAQSRRPDAQGRDPAYPAAWLRPYLRTLGTLGLAAESSVGPGWHKRADFPSRLCGFALAVDATAPVEAYIFDACKHGFGTSLLPLEAAEVERACPELRDGLRLMRERPLCCGLPFETVRAVGERARAGGAVAEAVAGAGYATPAGGPFVGLYAATARRRDTGARECSLFLAAQGCDMAASLAFHQRVLETGSYSVHERPRGGAAGFSTWADAFGGADYRAVLAAAAARRAQMIARLAAALGLDALTEKAVAVRAHDTPACVVRPEPAGGRAARLVYYCGMVPVAACERYMAVPAGARDGLLLLTRRAATPPPPLVEGRAGRLWAFPHTTGYTRRADGTTDVLSRFSAYFRGNEADAGLASPDLFRELHPVVCVALGDAPPAAE